MIEATADTIKRVEALLLEHGFKMQVGGCGCCASPWVRIEHNGEMILDDDNVDMFYGGKK